MAFVGWEASIPEFAAAGSGSMALAALLAAAAAVLGAAVLKERSLRGIRGDRVRHGWATRHDVRSRGLFGTEGIILGRWGPGGPLIRSSGSTHVFLAAPTRSGKGSGFVIPNLLDWPGSVVVFDIKGENHAASAGFRASHGHQVVVFDPECPNSCRWNPLHGISSDPSFRARDLQRLAAALYAERSAAEAFWTHQARELFVGAAMLALETRGASATLGHVQRFLSAPGAAARVLETFGAPEVAPPDVSADCTKRLLQWAECGSDAMRAGIHASANERLLIWSEPLLDRATSASDFRLADLRRRRMAVYVRVAPSALVRLAPVLRLFFEQLVHENTSTPFCRRLGNSVPMLLMLDEFPALGRASAIESAIAYMASFGLRCCIIAQSESQLRGAYGEDGARTVIRNCANRIHFAPEAADEAADLSAALGTVLVPQRTRSRSAGLFSGSAPSLSVTLAERPLLRPHEARAMSPNMSILLVPGCRPIRAAKIRWWRDGEFSRRQLPLPTQELPASRN